MRDIHHLHRQEDPIHKGTLCSPSQQIDHGIAYWEHCSYAGYSPRSKSCEVTYRHLCESLLPDMVLERVLSNRYRLRKHSSGKVLLTCKTAATLSPPPCKVKASWTPTNLDKIACFGDLIHRDKHLWGIKHYFQRITYWRPSTLAQSENAQKSVYPQYIGSGASDICFITETLIKIYKHDSN